jgi:hypothetical protein
MTNVFRFLLAALLLAACSKNGSLPRTAALCGDQWISCTSIKPGMYRCRTWRAADRAPGQERIFIFPFLHGAPRDTAIAAGIARYDGETIVLKDGRKLIAADIPDDAERVASLPGGAWVSCRSVDAAAHLYACNIYAMKNGTLFASGTYVLKRYAWDPAANRVRYTPVKGPAPVWDYVYYGGIGISLNNRMVLMPVDWIDYPDSIRSGMRKKYDARGTEIAQEEY